MMWFIEGVAIAFQSIAANKLRSILTLIGIIIGVTTVIAVVSVINGMNNYVAVKINSMGSNTFIIDKARHYHFRGRLDQRPEAQGHHHRGYARHRARLCPLRKRRRLSRNHVKRVKHGSSYLEDVSVFGTTYNFIDITDVEIEYGRELDQNDETHRSAVCIVGPDIVENLIKNGSPLGQNIKVGNYYFPHCGCRQGRAVRSWARIRITGWASR